MRNVVRNQSGDSNTQVDVKPVPQLPCCAGSHLMTRPCHRITLLEPYLCQFVLPGRHSQTPPPPTRCGGGSHRRTIPCHRIPLLESFFSQFVFPEEGWARAGEHRSLAC